MGELRKKYVVDERNRRVAVQIDIEAFEKIEEILENYALVQLMKENEADETLELKQAKAYYQTLEKAD
jgi:acetyl-CoA carboxylase beta subunit